MRTLFISLFFAAAFLFTAGNAYAQKYAYVDTEYILNKIPEYGDAQAELDELAVDWQKEIEAKFAKISEMYDKYRAEAVLLPEDIKQQREDEIVKMEKEAKALQKKYFGSEGDLFIRRQELIKPIQDKVYNAIEEMATRKNYDFIFDKAGELTILFADPNLDISNDVLEKMGYSATETN